MTIKIYKKQNIFPIVAPPASESNLEKLKHFHGNAPSKPILLSDISQSYQSSVYENNAALYATDTVSSTMYNIYFFNNNNILGVLLKRKK